MAVIIGGFPSFEETLRYHEHIRLMESQSVAESALYLGYANMLDWLRQRSITNSGKYGELREAAQNSCRAGDGDTYWRCVNQFCVKRRVFRTQSGVLGVGPGIMKTGDSVVCLFGGRLPYVLRPQEQGWSFLGEAYIRHETVMSGKEMMDIRSTKDQTAGEVFAIS
jgi:hypothetical protein